ncbi:tetratricopeptide repeat protein [Paraburkholderia nodosa]|uniref:tetratricopeptide repeat protein n=1 Tax=Paraburkholderia nodosa TaxID=392320 RepID=UPI0004AD09C5|nr:hypothetical protein [Paraburkholderia nodosa]
MANGNGSATPPNDTVDACVKAWLKMRWGKIKSLPWWRILACLLYLFCTGAAIGYNFWPRFETSTRAESPAAVAAATAAMSTSGSAATPTVRAQNPALTAPASAPAVTLQRAGEGDAALMTEGQMDVSYQGIFVLMLTFLAFLMHWLKGETDANGFFAPVTRLMKLVDPLGGHHFLFAIPTLTFFAAMIRRRHEDAAVFLMAVLAIYVAAEHFVALKEQHRTARDILTKMREQAGKLEEHTSRLGNLQTELEARAREVGSVIGVLNKHVESIRNSLGKDYSQANLYRAYRNRLHVEDDGIYAVYRLLDIDEAWRKAPLTDKWTEYFDLAKSPDSLYAALMEGRRAKVLIVTDMPLRLVALWDEHSKPVKSRAAAFLRFFGLLWHTVVLQQAARDLYDQHHVQVRYDVKVGDSSNWMHVVDSTVYQLFGEPPKHVYLRDLTLDITGNDERTKRNLVNWAVEDIRRTASRAATAKDYIGTVFSDALMARGMYQTDVSLSHVVLDQILFDIGFGDWLGFPEGVQNGLTPEDAKTLFRDMIRRFLFGLAGGEVALTARLIYKELQ